MRTIVTIVLLCLTVLPARSQDAASVQLFDEGTAALIDGRFHDALRAFETVQTAGWGSDALYYNMAMAHYRLDNLGQAVRYLEKARLLNEDDPRIEHSLGIALQRQPDRFSQLPDPFWKKARQWFTKAVPARIAFLFGLLCWFGFVAGWLVRTVFHHDHEWLRRGRFVMLTAGLLLLAHALASSISPPHPARSVVLTDTLTLREQASQDAGSVVEVHEGLIVEVRTEAPEWRFIEIPNGTRGWVPSSTLGDI
jgi:tetratricopeptide (TPR) repeat protein